jgi:CHAT domain-containing protein
MAEQAFLQQWKAVPLEAKKAELETVATGVRIPGHLIHFAVHGLSDVAANHQAILLADNTQIMAAALTGRYRCGETPRFAFVFLNACQVGTAGESLGQAAGFPGILVRRGALGFIAPMWEVHDLVAREFAETFYKEVFDNKQTVGAALQAQRCGYDSKGSTTPIAYIYYGHPALRLSYEPIF